MAWKALAVLGIFAAGAMAAFATVYSLGWREGGGEVRMITATSTSRTAGSRVYTLREGDDLRVPAVGVRCHAGVEGSFPNLLCGRYPRGLYTFAFYNDSVAIFGPGAEPMTPSQSLHWQPK